MYSSEMSISFVTEIRYHQKCQLSINRIRSKYVCTTHEITKANKLLLNKDAQPDILYKCITIPG